MGARRATAYIKSSAPAVQPNTFIGGVGGVITNETELASYLSIAPGNISNFQILGNDVSCYIDDFYSIVGSAFNNSGDTFDWGNGAIITYYIDKDGYCSGLENKCFDAQDNLSFVEFPGVTTVIGSGTFKAILGTQNKLFLFPQLLSITNGVEMFRSIENANISMPKLNQLGLSTADDAIFILGLSTTVYVGNALSTVNGGGADGDLSYLSARPDCNVKYSSNSTAPSPITDLALETKGGTYLKINWTAPTSTNSIDKYVILCDDKPVGETKDTFYFNGNLDLNTTCKLQVIVIDEMGNYAKSNVIVETTDVTYTGVPLSSFVSYWNFNGNSNDLVGANDGTDTSMAYVDSGGIGDVADFTAGTLSNITVSDADNISFGNGSSDSPFTFYFRFKFSTVSDTFFFDKRAGAGTGQEYIIRYTGSQFLIRFWDESLGGYTDAKFTIGLTSGTWYTAAALYKGSGDANDIKMFLGTEILEVAAVSTTGSYTAMENLSGDLLIGKRVASTSGSLNGYMDETAVLNKEISFEEYLEMLNKNNSGIALNA